MKMFESKRKKVLSIPLVLLVLLFFVGCQQEYDFKDNSLPFLTLNGVVDASKLSQNDIIIINEAFQRLNINTENGLFYIEQTSGDEVNISEELYQFFKTAVDSSNEELELSEIDLSVARTRNSSEAGGGNGSPADCVAYTIVAMCKSFGNNNVQVTVVSNWIDNECGGDGVPMDKMNYVLNNYLHATQVPIPINSIYPLQASIGMLRSGGVGNGHCVTVLAIDGSTMVYRDDQGEGKVYTRSVTDLMALYRVNGCR